MEDKAQAVESSSLRRVERFKQRNTNENREPGILDPDSGILPRQKRHEKGSGNKNRPKQRLKAGGSPNEIDVLIRGCQMIKS